MAHDLLAVTKFLTLRSCLCWADNTPFSGTERERKRKKKGKRKEIDVHVSYHSRFPFQIQIQNTQMRNQARRSNYLSEPTGQAFPRRTHVFFIRAKSASSKPLSPRLHSTQHKLARVYLESDSGLLISFQLDAKPLP